MQTLQQLDAIYNRFDSELSELRRNRIVSDGFKSLLSGQDSAAEAVCRQFFADIQGEISELVKQAPSSDEASEVISRVLAGCAAENDFTKLSCLAVHGFLIELVPFLAPQRAEEFFLEYAKRYKKLDRLPVMDTFYKSLKAQSKKDKA